MQPYVTPERYRTMGLGADLEGVEDWELRSILSSATSLVNTYCNVPLLPQAHDFRGGTITNEQHQWTADPHGKRIYLWHTPIKTITSLKVMATSNQYLDVSADELFIQPGEGYTEIVALALTSVGLFGAAVPVIGLTNPITRTSYTYGYEFPVTGEYLEPTDAWTYRAQNQFWTAADVTVYRDGVEITTGFTVDRIEGAIVFDEPQEHDDILTVDYTYSLPREIAQATAIAATTALAERDLTSKGLGQLAEIAVEEVRLRRDARRTGTVVAQEALPDSAQALLSGFRFVTVM